MKKYFSVASIICVLILCFCGITSYAAENTTEFFGGDGTKNNPYIIGTKEHLNNVRNYPDAYFELAVDLTFNEDDFATDGAFYNAGDFWLPIGSAETPFSGSFNGNGHTISGIKIYFYKESSVAEGLFAYNSGIIKNLNITQAKLEVRSLLKGSTIYVGGIVGYNDGNIENCYFSSSVFARIERISTSSEIYTNEGLIYAGGIAGYNTGSITKSENAASISAYEKSDNSYAGGIAGYSTGSINECDNSGVVSNATYKGGIAGQNAGNISYCYNVGQFSGNYCGGITGQNAGNISYCYNVGHVSGSYCGGITGENQNSVQDCFNIGNVGNSKYSAGICGYNTGNISTSYNAGIVNNAVENPCVSVSLGTVTNCYYYNDPLQSFNNGLSKEQMMTEQAFENFDFSAVWKFDTDTDYPFPVLRNLKSISFSNSGTDLFDGGNGFPWDPYNISTKENFVNIAQNPNAYYKLTNDISFSEPIDSFDFSGCFDGNGHTINYSFSVTDTETGKSSQYSLFNNNTGLICNLSVNLNLQINVYSASVAGIVYGNSGIIRNCKTGGTINVQYGSYTNSTYIGGITYSNRGKIIGCTNFANITGEGKYAGIGGIARYSNGSITNCVNNGVINAGIGINGDTRSVYAGGIIGDDCGNIENCVNNGNITANANVYKKSGYGYSSVIVKAFAGGIVGDHTSGTEYGIVNCSNNGDVIAEATSTGVPYKALISCAGGICGITGYTTKYNYVVVSFETTNMCKIECCVNSGNISALSSEKKNMLYDGIAGKYYGNISSCYDASTFAKDKVSLQSSYPGLNFESDWIILPGKYAYPQLQNNLMTPVSSVYIAQQPSKTIECSNGHFVSYNGMKIGIRFEDGTTTTTEPWPEYFSLVDVNSKGKQTVPLKVLGYTTNDTVDVIVRDKCLDSIEVKTLPTLKRYHKSEKAINVTGAVLKIIYDDKSEETVDINSDMVEGFVPGKVGVQTLTVNYEGKQCTFEITVYEEVGIEIEKTPTKTVYVQGQALSGVGGTFNLLLSDGQKVNYSLENATLDYPKDKIGDAQATVSYLGYTANFAITINERIVETVKIVDTPTKTIYRVGENIELDGGTVKVSFKSDDNYYEILQMTNDIISGFDSSNVGYPTITVSYGGKSDSFVVRVKEAYISGDLNGDDKVTDRDAIYLMYHIYSPINYPIEQDCDFNKDGKVTDRDAIYLMYHTFSPINYPLN